MYHTSTSLPPPAWLIHTDILWVAFLAVRQREALGGARRADGEEHPLRESLDRIALSTPLTEIERTGDELRSSLLDQAACRDARKDGSVRARYHDRLGSSTSASGTPRTSIDELAMPTLWHSLPFTRPRGGTSHMAATTVP